MTKRKSNTTEIVRRYYAKFPNAKSGEAAAATGIDVKHLYVIKNKLKTSGRLPTTPEVPMTTMTTVTTDESFSALLEKVRIKNPEQFKGVAKPLTPSATPDLVNQPPHYTVGGVETIDFIEAKKLNYNLGNVVKYLTRAEHKGNKLEDLRKAQWYLTREISLIK
jgi:hypothetical protein